MDKQTVKDEHLKELSRFPSLSSVWIDRDAGITPAGLEAIVGIKSLERLWLFGNVVSDEAAVHIAKLTSLKILTARNGTLTDDGMKRFGTLVNLDYLDVEGNRHIAGRTLGVFKSAKRMTYVNLGKTGATDLKGLSELKELPLGFINLTGTPIDDNGARELSALKSLRSLILKDSKITDTGLHTLKDIPNLQLLIVAKTNVTSQSLSSFKSMKSLTALHVGKKQFKEEEVAEIKRTVRGIVVEREDD